MASSKENTQAEVTEIVIDSNNATIQQQSNEDVKKDEVKTIGFIQMFRYADAYDYFLMCIGAIGAAGSGVCFPIFTLIFGDIIRQLDSFAKEDQDNGGLSTETKSAITDEINKLALDFVIVGVAAWFGSYLEIACWQLAAVRQGNRIRKMYLKAIMDQDIEFFDAEASQGQLLQGLNADTNTLQQGMGDRIGQTIHHMVTFVAGLLVGYISGWKMALVLTACLPLIMAAGAIMGKMQAWAAHKCQDAYSKANSVAIQNVQNVRTVAANTAEQTAIAQYSGLLAYPTKIARFAGIVAGSFTGLANSFFFWTYGIALLSGAKFIRDDFVLQPDGTYEFGTFDGGEAMTVLFAILMGSFSLGQAAPNFEFFARGRVAGYKIFSVLDREPKIKLDAPGIMVSQDPSVRKPKDSEVVNIDEKQRVVTLKGEITFEKVCFAYPIRPDVDVLKGLSASFTAGQSVALVGSSGSGKSTVVQLLMRFYDPRSGNVLIDGIPLPQFSLRSYRAAVGLVSQEPTLFATTIRENIAYGKEGCSLEEVEAAAKAANAYHFISQLPEGLNTWVGEAGVQLSGGQKQRIAIARAILKNPPILMLDEATSALDTQSERVVQAAIDDMIAGSSRTTVVIAHRLSTIRNADSIVVINEGQMVEHGTHDELMKNPTGSYCTLVKLQNAAAAKQDDKTAEEEDENVDPDEILAVTSIKSGDSKKTKSSVLVSQIAQSKKSSKKIDIEGKDLADLDEDALPKPNLRRLLQYNKPEMHLLVLGILLSVIIGCVFPGFAFILSEMIATLFNVDKDQQAEDALQWSLIIISIGFGYLALAIVQQTCFTIMGTNLTRRIREQMFTSLLYQDIGFFDREQNSSGVLTSQLESSCASVRGAVGDTLGLLIQNTATMGCGFIIGFVLDYLMTLVILATVPFMIVGSTIQFMFFGGADASADEDYALANDTVLEALMSMRTVHAYILEDKVLQNYSQQLQGPIKANNKKAHVGGVAFGFSQFMMFISFAVAFWYGGVRLKDGGISFDEILKVFFAIFFGSMGASQAQLLFPEAAKAGPAAKKVFAVIDRTPVIKSQSKAGETPSTIVGKVEYRNVKFIYPSRPDVVVLNNFSLTIEAGKKVALVGESGSGKSTAVAILERFYNISSGQVLLDGKDITNLQVTWLRSHIGLVSQEPVLFSMTLKENVRYGNPNATDDDVQAALKAANALEFVSALSKGLDTHLGDLGIKLSGGQKQRIAIARAIIRNPKLLLLDEATSALDAASEREVQGALEQVMLGRTTIAIAHRLSTIRNFDKIAVLQRGVLLEMGTHEELMSKPDGSYVQLVQHQMQA